MSNEEYNRLRLKVGNRYAFHSKDDGARLRRFLRWFPYRPLYYVRPLR